MKARNIERLAHLLFWGVTSWVILTYFTIEVRDIELINDVEQVRIRRSTNLVSALAINQLAVLVLFYRQVREVLQLTTWRRIGHFWLRSVAWFAGLFTLQFVVNVLITPLQPATFPWVLFLGIFTFYYAVALSYGFAKLSWHNERARQRLLLEKRQSELHLLRSQLQPHFLFNTLNNLLAMVDQTTNRQLAGSIERLASLLRYVVYDTQQDKIPVAKEIEFLQDYAALYQLRYDEEEVDFSLHVHGTHQDQPIEPGLLIPFLENAFKHGVLAESCSFVRVEVDVSRPGTVGFMVENSVHPQTNDMSGPGGVGIAASRKRLDLVYPNRYALEIHQSDPFRIHLTIQTYEGDHRR